MPSLAQYMHFLYHILYLLFCFCGIQCDSHDHHSLILKLLTYIHIATQLHIDTPRCAQQMMIQQASLGLKIVHTIITAWKWSMELKGSLIAQRYGLCQHWMVSCYCVYSGDIPLYSNNILLVSCVINYDIAVLPNPLIVLPQKCSSLELRRKIMLQTLDIYLLTGQTVQLNKCSSM